MQVLPEDIGPISRLVEDLCGVALDESKAYLMQSRLSGVAEVAGCRTFNELCFRARYGNDQTLRLAIVDAITTGETSFFRDGSPFHALRQHILPELIQAKARSTSLKRLRIWSAGCGAGQEPYSIAMVLCESMTDLHIWDAVITATDVSDAAIAQASRGRYADLDVQRGLPPELLAKYFLKEPGGARVKDSLRALVAFRRFNLLEPLIGLGPFDIIFCRNVAIYFRPEARRSLFHRLTEVLTEDGCLFVGSSESLMDLGPQFLPLHQGQAVYYQPRKQAAGASA